MSLFNTKKGVGLGRTVPPVGGRGSFPLVAPVSRRIRSNRRRRRSGDLDLRRGDLGI